MSYRERIITILALKQGMFFSVRLQGCNRQEKCENEGERMF